MKLQLFFGLLCIAALGSSCAAYLASRQTKKDDKIYKNAVTNERVFPRVGEKWNLENPITQKTIYIQGKDSIIEVPVIVDVVRDSIIKVECPTLNLDSLKRSLTHVVIKLRIDTLIVADTTCERRLNSVLTNYSKLQGKSEQQTIQQKDTEKKKQKNFWLAIAGWGAFVISWVGYFVIKIKSK